MSSKSPQHGSAASRARAKSAEMRKRQQAAQRRRRVLNQVLLVVVAVVVVVGTTIAVLVSRDDAPETATGAPPGITEDGSILIGSDDAAVTVTLIEDFQCPACRAFEAADADLLASYAADDAVRLEYRPIAFLDRASSTEYSSRALNAAACFYDADPDDWLTFHNLLFDNQPAEGSAGLTDDVLTDLAVQAGAERADVEQCIADRSYDDWVESTTEVTTNLDVFEGTPTVLVNGEKVADVSPASLEAAVDAAR